jgi:NADPH:quinone reductase
MGLVGGGAHADLLVVDEHEVMAMPPGMSFVQAAAIPEAFLTAWDAIVIHGRAAPGERILMHAIGSGVGTAAVQLARVFGLELIGTSRTAAKLERCAVLGLRNGVLTTEVDWPAKVGDLIDVLVDPLGAEFFAQNLALLANQGRMIVLGTMTGAIGPAIDLGALLRRRLEIIGTAMRIRRSGERARLVARFTEEVLPFFRDGSLVPVVDSVLDAADAAAAYNLLAGNTTFGKIILRHR